VLANLCAAEALPNNQPAFQLSPQDPQDFVPDSPTPGKLASCVKSPTTVLWVSDDTAEMTLEERMDKIEKALGSQDDLVRELRDAVTVTAVLEARQARILKEHGEWLAHHDAATKAHNEAMKGLDARIANLVSGVGEFMRRQPAPE
jgi:uncharacterized coiled-coil protein SlyX